MNSLTISLIGLIISASISTYTYYLGREDGAAAQIASQKTAEDLINKVKEEFDQSVATRIANIRVTHTTVQGRLVRETSTNTVYRECEHSDAGMQLINDALTNSSRTISSGNSQLPKAVDAPNR